MTRSTKSDYPRGESVARPGIWDDPCSSPRSLTALAHDRHISRDGRDRPSKRNGSCRPFLRPLLVS